MLWMMGIQPCHPSLVVSNVVEKCIQSIIKDFTVTNIKFQMLEENKRTEAMPRFFLMESLPPGALWNVSIIGEPHVRLSTMAILLGGNVRVGIEDNIYYSRGVLGTNAQQVERIVKIARMLGREIATPDEAREILGLKPKA